MADFEIGDLVKAKKFGPMDHDFTGIVEKVYNNSVMISIQDFDPSDKNGVNELNSRAVIRQSEAKTMKTKMMTKSLPSHLLIQRQQKNHQKRLTNSWISDILTK